MGYQRRYLGQRWPPNYLTRVRYLSLEIDNTSDTSLIELGVAAPPQIRSTRLQIVKM